MTTIYCVDCGTPGTDAKAHGLATDHTVISADLIDLTDRALVLAAVRRAAQIHGPVISANEIRSCLDRHAIRVPQHIGSAYQTLIGEGYLKPLDDDDPSRWARSSDRDGRNQGKPCQFYRVDLKRVVA